MNKSDEFDVLWEDQTEEVSIQQIEQAWSRHEAVIFNKPKVYSIRKYLYYAASVAAVVVIGLVLFFQNQVFFNPQIVSVNAPADSVLDLYLPDSTHIILSPNAKITYSENFITNRQVTLIGNAYFNVTKDKEHSFSIQSGKWNSTVLGTSFFIKQDQDTFSVSLFEGNVKVKDLQGKTNFLLQSGQKFVESKNEKEPIVKELFPQSKNGNKYIDFNQVPLNYVLGFIESHYQIPVVYKGVNNPIVTFRWDYDDQLKTQLQFLSQTTGIPIVLDGKKIKVNHFVD